MATDGMVLVPVDSDRHIRMLREYRKLLQSTMGPNGSCKAIVTGGGYLEVTSVSKALAARLELTSPICKYINNMTARFADNGLFCGVLLSHLLEQQWQDRITSKNKIMQTFAVLAKQLKSCLLSENVCIQLNFDSIQNLLPIVRTIIKSKCSVFLSGMDIDRLCIEIIKVFLNCVDDETNVINRVYTKVESGCDGFTSYKGLIYTVTENHNIEIARGLEGDIKILVFVLKLEDNDELYSAFDKVKPILENAVQSGVKIIAFQKTISPEIKIFLRRRKIVLLERMGSDFTKMLIDISQAFPISQLNIEEFEGVKLTGYLSSIEHVQFNECDYLVLHNQNVPVGTLLVQTSTLLGKNTVQALILQALAALRTIAADPQVTLGGGCLETWLIGRIHQLKGGEVEKDFRLVSTWVQRALQSTCSAVEMDSIYHHGWRDGADKCGCGLVLRGEVEREGGLWLMLQEVVSCQARLQSPRQPDTTLRPEVLVGPHQQKLKVIEVVFEVFANLSDVGLIVSES